MVDIYRTIDPALMYVQMRPGAGLLRLFRDIALEKKAVNVFIESAVSAKNGVTDCEHEVRNIRRLSRISVDPAAESQLLRAFEHSPLCPLKAIQ